MSKAGKCGQTTAPDDVHSERIGDGFELYSGIDMAHALDTAVSVLHGYGLFLVSRTESEPQLRALAQYLDGRMEVGEDG